MMLRVDRSVCPLLVQGLRIAGPILCMVLSTGLNAASQTDLVEAVKSGDISAVRDLLSAKVDVNVTQGDGATALHWAAYRDDLESAELLIAAGADVDVANDLGVTPLALASANPTASLAEKLLDFGADPHFASEIGVTPLMEAARTGNVAAMQALLDRGASVNAVESAREQTALMWAVSERHPEIVKALLENGADVSVRSLTRIRMVKLDSRGGGRRSPEVATPLELGGSTSLVFAARVGDVESTRLLLEAGRTSTRLRRTATRLWSWRRLLITRKLSKRCWRPARTQTRLVGGTRRCTLRRSGVIYRRSKRSWRTGRIRICRWSRDLE